MVALGWFLSLIQLAMVILPACVLVVLVYKILTTKY